MYLNKPLKEFIEKTSSKTPTPGGGSVAALVGCLGTSLICMVANFTIGNKRYESVEEEVKHILKKAEDLKSKFADLISEDIQAYEGVSQATKMPKDNEEMRKRRFFTLQERLKKAALVPHKTASSCFQLIKLAQSLLPKANPNLITDIGVGVLFAESALQSAIINVEVNLAFIKDKKFNIERKKELSLILHQAEKIKNDVLKEVKKKIQ
ncbi:cyclodeaminase/cyclohydrolase family protein [Candidatus Aerophobetes bacterium]|nr:cyclodeaminase/cyclohydrolase family protein [Candidatus Aerophobetes bacterium]